jgi:hypothetical protein
MKIKFSFENMWKWDTTTIRLIPELTFSHLFLWNKFSQTRKDLSNPELHINWLGFIFGVKITFV